MVLRPMQLNWFSELVT